MRRIPSAGYTMVEVLVTVGLIGILAGLVLPAVQSSREAARRIQCASHLKDLGLALHAYEDARGRFPPLSTLLSPDGSVLTPYSPHSLLLPYIEQGQLYNSINFYITSGLTIEELAPANHTSALTNLDILLCPSDGGNSTSGFGMTNYRSNVGICFACGSDGSGAFSGRGATAAEFRDGLAYTIAFSEKPVGSPSGDGYTPFRDWINLPLSPVHRTPDDWVDICSSLREAVHPSYSAGRTWLIAGARHVSFFTAAGPNTIIPDCGITFAGGTGLFTARSYHPGGVNAVMMDGAVRWTTSGVSMMLWRALGTRNGGEVAY